MNINLKIVANPIMPYTPGSKCTSHDGQPSDRSTTGHIEKPATPDILRTTILQLVEARGHGKSICPSEVARHLAGQDEKRWRLLMKPIRAEAVKLATEGAIEITRKGKPIDPAELRGVYRLRTPN
ncbi:MAG: DUF3253 domain-containing protein [Pseudomonadota bacterium]